MSLKEVDQARFVTIRPYTSADFDACRALFLSNVPRYFGADEEPGYLSFLGRLPGPYFVIEDGGEVVACGGWSSDGDVAVLCWGMAHPSRQRSGIGTTLLRARIEGARSQGFSRFRTRTSQLTEGFFAKHGFRVTNRTPDGFSSGLDCVEMILEL